jgi:hypothetical protein
MTRNQLPSERFYEREYNILKKENERLKEELKRLEDYNDIKYKRWTDTPTVVTFDNPSIPLHIIATGEISNSYYGTEIIVKNTDGLRFSYQVSNPDLYQTTDKMNAVYFLLQEMLLRLFKLKKNEN